MKQQFLFYISALIFMIASCSIGAQSKVSPLTPQKVLSSKQQKVIQEINSDIRLNYYDVALEKLDKFIAKTPDYLQAYILKGEVQYRLENLKDAAISLEYVIQQDSLCDVNSFYTLGRIYQQLKDIDRAKKNYHRFIRLGKNENLINRAKSSLEQLDFIDYAVKHPVAFNPEKLDKTINGTPSSESLPLFTVDGRQMIFTRKINGQEDLYTSSLDQNGKWTEAVPLDELNTPQNDGAHAISADGQVIIFTGCNWEDGLGGCDLYISEKMKGKWGKPKNMGAPINTRAREAQPTLSADGRTMYFVSDRADGVGGRDIWRSKRRPDGLWSVPRNVGPTINTTGDDESPHLHFDGRHLYFMSNGHIGMGDSDLYLSTLKEGNWSSPINLGYPINTEAREGALSVSPDGEYAYFTSNRKLDSDNEEKYDHDIYRFKLPDGLKPDPVSFGIFNIVDASTNKLIPAEISVFDQTSNELLSSFEYLPTQPSPLVTFALGNHYGVHITSPGYVFYSSTGLLFDDISINKFDTITIALSKLEVSSDEETLTSPTVLNNVFFSSGSADLSPSSFFELDRLLDLLNSHPDIIFQISGHTDDVGSEADNLALSQLRAEAVRNYLLARGIAASRVRAVGYGESQPIADNGTEKERAMNRRTEFFILKK